MRMSSPSKKQNMTQLDTTNIPQHIAIIEKLKEARAHLEG